jgi:hypothetical protein
VLLAQLLVPNDEAFDKTTAENGFVASIWAEVLKRQNLNVGPSRRVVNVEPPLPPLACGCAGCVGYMLLVHQQLVFGCMVTEKRSP